MAGVQGALTKDNPARMQRDESIALGRLTGKTYAELAKHHGISEATVSRVLNDEEVKEVIETGAKLYAGMIPKAISNYESLLDSKDEKIKHSASKDVLTATGIQPSHAQSIVIQNSFNRQSVELTPEVLSLLQSRPISGQIIDCSLDLDGDGD